MRYLVSLLLLLLHPLRAFAEFIGPVVSVLDGDTIEVLDNTRPERVRLSGIDCPETNHVWCPDVLEDLCLVLRPYGFSVWFLPHPP